MNRRLPLPILALALNFSLSFAPSADANTMADPPADSDNRTGDSIVSSDRALPAFQLSRIDKSIVREFEKAWWISSNGTNGKEGAVLIFQSLSGTYFAKVQRKTNEQRKVSFTWVPSAIAIVHTHPNKSDPRPSQDDMKLADRLNVTMFTISVHGMWAYNPATGKTTLVHQGLDWLDAGKWTRRAEASLESHSTARSAESSQSPSLSSQKSSLSPDVPLN